MRGTDGASLAAARAVLKALYERQDFDGATSWMDALPADVQQALRRTAKPVHACNASRCSRRPNGRTRKQCLALAPPVLGGDLSCDVLYEMSEFQSCL